MENQQTLLMNQLQKHALKRNFILEHSMNEMSRVRNIYMLPRIIAFIPAHNEEKAIGDCLAGLADQSLPKNVELDVFVIADNCTDRTEENALKAAKEYKLNVIVLKTKNNKQRKVGALNTAWKYIYGDP